ncbi:MAG: methionyl-tRNA formyltransferase, partial [Desulfarculus sp.]|nr:methionyl-tRNA formyltransferase [Desulfarculus sp.]
MPSPDALRLIFMGTPAIAAPSLEALAAAGHRILLVITQPDRPAGRGRKLQRGAVAAAADALSLPVAQPERAAQIIPQLAALAPDALVVVAFGQVLPPELLAIPRLGAINLHTSLLPALRGAAPIQRAIINGLAETGVSTMFMDAGLDTGDIILQRATPIGPQETAGELTQRLGLIGAELLVQTLAALVRGQAPRRPQDPTRASLAPRLRKDEGRVDWTRPAREIDWLVRGVDPWPGAFTLWRGQPLKLFAPTRVEEIPSPAPPGSLLPSPPEAGFLRLATGRGVLGL